jgi:hypothetical protein
MSFTGGGYVVTQLSHTLEQVLSNSNLPRQFDGILLEPFTRLVTAIWPHHHMVTCTAK